MSTHVVPVIRVEQVIPHPNADRLDLIPVKGWQCAVQKGAFKVGDLAVYIEPDMAVPVDRPEFSFLKNEKRPDKTHERIRAKRLRGEMSFGLMIPAPDRVSFDSVLGPDTVPTEVNMNLMDFYGVIRWQPPEVPSFGHRGFTMSRADVPGLLVDTGKFDLENIKNFPNVIDFANEAVVVTEKIHGSNARFCWAADEFFVGSRSQWLRRPTEEEMDKGHKLDAWHRVADNLPAIEAWCRRHPFTILYGEIYGNVQDLKYGLPDSTTFAGFAAYRPLNDEWIDTEDLFVSLDVHAVPRVPILASGMLSRAVVEALAEGDTAIATAPLGHMREGVVITPIRERRDRNIGRVSLKYVSNRYWER